MADRVNKRNIMVGLDFFTAGIILVFYLLHGRVQLVPLMIVCLMLLYGISGTYQPAVQASIPALLQDEGIVRGNAVINMVGTLSGLLGPVIGGVLFGMRGITPILLISVGCFVFSAVMEIFIHIPWKKQTKSEGICRTVGGDLRESLRFMKDERPIFFRVAAVLAFFNLVLSAAMITGIPVIVVNFLGMSDAKLGITQGALGMGGLFGGILAGMLGERLRIRHGFWSLFVCSLATAVMGAGLLPFVPKLGGYLIVTCMGFVEMAVSTLFVIQLSAVVQRQTPPHLIGKIMAFLMAVANCASPLGQAMYGLVFDLGRSVSWVILFGVSLISLGISLYGGKLFRRLEQETESKTSLL